MRRKSSSSGSGSGSGLGPLAHSITMSSTTSTPFEDTAMGGSSKSLGSSGSGGRQRWPQGDQGSVKGLRDLLPSLQQEMSAELAGPPGSSFMLPTPSFVESSKSFEAARAHSWQQGQQQGQQPTPASPEGSKDAADAPAAAATAAAGDQGGEDQQELVRLLFARYNPTSANYTGLDVEVVLRLSTLVFYCNRPTVAALMVFGTDLGAVNALLAGPAAEAQVCAATESVALPGTVMMGHQLLTLAPA